MKNDDLLFMVRSTRNTVMGRARDIARMQNGNKKYKEINRWVSYILLVSSLGILAGVCPGCFYSEELAEFVLRTSLSFSLLLAFCVCACDYFFKNFIKGNFLKKLEEIQRRDKYFLRKANKILRFQE